MHPMASPSPSLAGSVGGGGPERAWCLPKVTQHLARDPLEPQVLVPSGPSWSGHVTWAVQLHLYRDNDSATSLGDS